MFEGSEGTRLPFATATLRTLAQQHRGRRRSTPGPTQTASSAAPAGPVSPQQTPRDEATPGTYRRGTETLTPLGATPPPPRCVSRKGHRSRPGQQSQPRRRTPRQHDEPTATRKPTETREPTEAPRPSPTPRRRRPSRRRHGDTRAGGDSRQEPTETGDQLRRHGRHPPPRRPRRRTPRQHTSRRRRRKPTQTREPTEAPRPSPTSAATEAPESSETPDHD